MSIPESSQPEQMDQCLEMLYEHRARALDPECTWTIRNEEWVVIDGLLDWFNELRVGSGEQVTS